MALVRVVLLVKEHLVVNNGRDSFASKKSSVQTIFSFLSADALFELDENFDQDLGIFRLILLLLGSSVKLVNSREFSPDR